MSRGGGVRRSATDQPPGAPPPRTTPWLRLALLAGVILAAFVVVTVASGFSAHRVKGWFTGNGAVGPLVYLVAAAALSTVLFPGPVLAGASGLLFGTALGFPVDLASAVLGATTAFLIGRVAAREAVEALLGERGLQVRRLIQRRGFLAVLYARIIPGLPYTLINYAAGLTRIRLGAFVLATALGSAPRTFAYVALGGSLRDLGSPAGLASIAALVLLGAVGLIIASRDPELRDQAGRLGRWAAGRRARRSDRPHTS